MTFSIGAIDGAFAAPSITRPAAPSTSGSDFAATLAQAVDGVQGQLGTADSLAVAAVTGDLSDIHDATIAATRAQVSLELISTLRNKGVDAFNEIMRMQA
ncbi:flagellar hook-basal body complex protein FliE [Desertivibrio insolitus]|uniref:flagellar hook-basal body complex protein FliE n=1 Tax=Herbiconiux sp. SYSU D00978 TaxID=2812562 RepID=UPI001A965524|nr:flagellar hook-basal body complex protein FliE [Herbiconiux sp. SYSU D00978]